MRCLLVDDEPGIREGMAMLLRRRGLEVQTAGTCEAARQMLRERTFDVVVTDWRLPDGEASCYVANCEVPVIAVSGHPEEVAAFPALRKVLGKPAAPTVLHEAILACRPADPDSESDQPSLAPVVQGIVDDVIAQLPRGTDVDCFEDGVFVVVRMVVPDGEIPALRHRGGDLRVIRGADGPELELRLCRDGRPSAETPVVPIDGPWPEHGRFAIDCRTLAMDPGEYVRWLGRVAARGAGRACLLNVPAALEPVTAGWERTHDMPMRGRVGPQLTAELIELWSQL